MNAPDKPVIFFDGVCGLCNRFVDFTIKRDRRGEFYFSPLQGKCARELLPEAAVDDLDSIALWRDGKVFYRSTAVLLIVNRLPGFFGFISRLGWIFPAFLRDFVYNRVARLPSSEERARFLD